MEDQRSGEAVLFKAVGLIQDGRNDDAVVALETLVRESRDLKTHVFAEALLKRLKGEQDRQPNLYLRDCQNLQIDLFNLIANKVPMVSAAADVANQQIAQALDGLPEATLLDVGIGTGRQEVALLELLAKRGRFQGELTVAGIEPAAEALALAEKNILARAAASGLRVRFRPILKCIEDFSEGDWADLRGLPGPLIVNEAFAVHHIPVRAGQGDLKDGVLKRLYDLRPRLFVLTEPHSNHQTPDFRARFENCWKHFGLVFDVVDRLEISEDEKNAIKVQFFAREIEDILGSVEERRSERHETAEMWTSRLRRAGFKLVPERLGLPERSPDVIRIAKRREFISLDLGTEPIVAVICAA